jgi:hypothetical protein
MDYFEIKDVNGTDMVASSGEELEKRIVQEIFDSILFEIRDEVNIPLELLSPPQLLGVIRNLSSGGRPSLGFYVRCSETSYQVKARYAIGGDESDESTDLLCIPANEVLSGSWKPNCSPSLSGCVQLWREFSTEGSLLTTG